MKNYNPEELNIINEKRDFLLSLRKKRINTKLKESRFKYLKKNIENQEINKKDNNNEQEQEKKNPLIINIKFKFDELLPDKSNTEEKYLFILQELIDNISIFVKNYKSKTISEPLIESNVIEKIYNDLMVKKYINNKEILNKVLVIYSCVVFIYNHFPHTNAFKKEFISNIKYINLYISLLDSKDDEEVIYNIYKFMGLLCHKSSEIMIKLYNEKIMDKIIDNNIFDDDIDIIQIKTWCISLFDINIKFNENINLSLKIQKYYFFVFYNFLNKYNCDIELLENFMKVIINLSYCIDDEYINKLLSSNILEFLLNSQIDENILEENILIIIGNMSCISNNSILSKLYIKSITFLTDILKSNKHSKNIYNLSLWCINNFTYNENLCLDIFIQKNCLSIYKNFADNETIDENIFIEICIGYKNLIHAINNNINVDNKYYSDVKEYNILSCIIEGFKKLENIKNIYKIGQNVIEVIFLLLTFPNEEFVNFNKNIFEIKGGNEYIFDKIKFILLQQNNQNNKEQIDEINEEYNILEFIHFIQTHLLYYETI